MSRRSWKWWAVGDRQALDDLTPIVYAELRRFAAGYLRKERPGHTLQPTAPVNEAYVRLLEQEQIPSCQNRSHFFAIVRVSAKTVSRDLAIAEARLGQWMRETRHP